MKIQLTMASSSIPVFWFVALFLFLIVSLVKKRRRSYQLPPSPPTIPILGNLLWLVTTTFSLGPTLRRLRSHLGPLVTLHIPFLPPCIFVMDSGLARRTLVRHAAAFSHRPPFRGSSRALRIHAHNINAAPYGPRFRILRQNLAVGLLDPTRIASYAHAHRWALDALSAKLQSTSESSHGIVTTRDSFKFAVYQALTLICFGDKLDEAVLRELHTLQCDFISLIVKLSAYSLLPSFAMVLFLKRWRTALDISRRLDELLVPLFRTRKSTATSASFVSYVDLLHNHKLDDDQMVSLCMEFLNASVETTSATLEWIMANLVKSQEIQERLHGEIKAMPDEGSEVDRSPYLRAVVLEGLRRHPAAHLALPHVSGEDVGLDGYVIPKGAIVNYAVGEMNWDARDWEEPMEFRPERFLGDGGETKIMTFGAGRRMCPGAGLAMSQLRYFVANLVAEFRWEAVDGEGVEMEEMHGLITTMKNPLRARIVSREAK